MPENKKSVAAVFLGFYLIFLGIFGLFNTTNPASREEMARSKYRSGKAFLTHSQEVKQQLEMDDEAVSEEFERRYREFDRLIERQYHATDSIALLRDWAISALIVLTAVAYVFAGILLLRGYARFLFYFRAACVSFVINYFVIVAATLWEFVPVQIKASRLLQLFYTQEQQDFSRSLMTRGVLLIIILFGIFYGFYVILPKTIIRRSRAIRGIFEENH